jgi:DNA-binding response OmpR family regulator
MGIAINSRRLLILGEIKIDVTDRNIRICDQRVELTSKEYDLFLFLARHRDSVVSRNAIMECITKDPSAAFDNFEIAYAHIKNLKRKLKDAGQKEYIKTVYGRGYVFQL